MRCSRPRHIGVTLIETFEQPSMRHADNRSSGKAVVMLLHSQRARLEQLAIGSGLRLLRSEPVGWMGMRNFIERLLYFAVGFAPVIFTFGRAGSRPATDG